MVSPAQAHAMRVAAMLVASENNPAPANASEYELMLLKLAQDRARLKQIESQRGKIEVKRKLLPEYVPWIEGALKGNGAQDTVLMTIMVWRIDTGDWRGALDIAAYALRHNLVLTDQFERNLPCLIAEEIAEQAKAGEPVPLAILLEADALLNSYDMPDQVRAKLAKAIGMAQLKEAGEGLAGMALVRKQQALVSLKRALGLHDACGVKKDIERLERELKNAAKPEESSSGTG
ncbi:terminase [Chitinimonas prasina]|uniref:Terminase n=1 Tax=Chitinimonas prasina TaxID=1434937 RepID=A0ABQ5YE49_9NEIS|nr:phage terminase small subunit [Chitinimonas prasina]GLR13250.1 terminase [Chitinimonas prasina]